MRGVDTIPKDEIMDVLKQSFNLVPDSMEVLDIYTNYNYKITCSGNNRSDSSKTSYVVKIFTAWEELDNFKMQYQVMEHLNKDGIVTSLPLIATDGEASVKCTLGGKQYVMQVLTFIEGEILNTVELTRNETESLYYKIGKCLGKIHVSLKTLNFQESPESTPSPYPWLLENTLMNEGKLSLLKDSQQKTLAKKYLDLFRENFLPRMSELPRGFTHGDYSDTNIVLKPSAAPSADHKWDISGIIDFGDLIFGHLVGDLGVSIAYCMLKSHKLRSNPVRDTGNIIRGYQAVRPLTPAEKEVLFEVASSRLVVSLLMAHHNVRLDPENRESIFVHADYCPAVLQTIETTGRRKVLEEWFKGQ